MIRLLIGLSPACAKISQLTGLFEHFEDLRDEFKSLDRLNYGCNCYATNLNWSPAGLDTTSFGGPKDKYDETCFDWKECYQEVYANFPDCKASETDYEFQLVGVPLDSVTDKDAVCIDSPCECKRWFCECDKVFAKQNVISRHAYNWDYEELTYVRNSAESGSDTWGRVSDTCSKENTEYKTFSVIEDYPCINPLSDGKDDSNNPTTSIVVQNKHYEIWNYDHDYEQAVKFCEARGAKLLPVDLAEVGNTVLKEIGAFIATKNAENNANIQLWLPYKLASHEMTSLRKIAVDYLTLNGGTPTDIVLDDNFIRLQFGNSQHCARNMPWTGTNNGQCSVGALSEALLPDRTKGSCLHYSYSNHATDSCDWGIAQVPCTQSQMGSASHYTVCSTDDNAETINDKACEVGKLCMMSDETETCGCPVGFQYDEADGCVDIKECSNGDANCIENSECIELVGSFKCQCKDGYSGSKDGVKGQCLENKADVNVELEFTKSDLEWDESFSNPTSDSFISTKTDILESLSAALISSDSFTVNDIQLSFHWTGNDVQIKIAIVYGTQLSDKTTFNNEIGNLEDELLTALKSLTSDDLTVTAAEAHSRPSACPTKACWELNTKTHECIVKENNDCFLLTCEFNKLKVVFGAALFGPSGTFGAWRTGENYIQPTYDSTSKKWTAECVLGNCGMGIGMDPTEENIDFKSSLALAPTYKTVDGMKLASNPGGIIDFICRYPNEVETTSNEFSILKGSASDTTTVVSSLSKGFSMKIYSDSTYSQSSAMFFVGRNIYAEVTWKITTAKAARFLLVNCFTTIVDTPVYVMKDTCFSANLRAKIWPEQAAKDVSQTSRFQYEAFVTKARLEETTTLTCQLKMCVNNCAELDFGAPGNDQCPNISAYNFKRFG